MKRSTGFGHIRHGRRALGLGAAALLASATLSGCTTTSSIQASPSAAPVSPLPIFGLMSAVFAILTVALGVLAAYALVLLITFLRLRIAELRRAAPPKHKPQD